MSRKSRKTVQETPVVVPAQTIFKTAIYARLSDEDKEAVSLDNQILMVKKYIEGMPDLKLCGVFSDNGQTGTNFNRSGFESLMDEIRKGRITCVVTKDLSRFGRNYIETGNFLEVIFPRLGVRFISIGDHYDSFEPHCQSDGMSVALKNMINAFYSKDISTKIRSAFELKRQKGEFTGYCPPFGYIKSPKNKNKLIIDEEAAKVVRMIFRLKLEGFGICEIARRLDEMDIPNPGHYRYVKGIVKDERYKKQQFWDISTVKRILEGIEYLGHLPTGKTKEINGKTKKVPKRDWMIKENTHDPIISPKDFDAVAEQFRQEKLRRDSLNKHNREELPENLLAGLIFCSDCGRSYKREANVRQDKVTYRLTYVCEYCNIHSPKYKYRRFKQSELYDAVYNIICRQIDICAQTHRNINNIHVAKETQNRKNSMDRRIKDIQKRMERFPLLKLKLYDNFCSGILNETEYKLIGMQYENEKIALSSELEQLLEEIKKLKPDFVDDNICISTFEQFASEKGLTREMLLALVERIEVSGDLTIHITFRYQDEYQRLAEFINEKGDCRNEQ